MDETLSSISRFAQTNTVTGTTTESLLSNLLDDENDAGTSFGTSFEQSDDFDLYSHSNDTFLLNRHSSPAPQGYSVADTTENNFEGTSQTSHKMEVIEQNGCGCSGCAGTASGLAHTSDEGGTIQSDGGIIDGGETDAAKPTATPEQFADYLTNGFWSDINSIARHWAQDTITYSISNEFDAGQKAGIRMAFDQWGDIADLTFNEVGSGGMIDLREGDDGRAFSSSSVYGNGEIASNYISIDTDVYGWDNFNDIGYYGLKTVIHEIGHSLGLGHSGNYNGSANYADDAIWANDTRQFSLMSYFQASYSGADHVGPSGTQYSSTPLLYDILAIQSIYGANASTRSGDTTYGWNSNAGRPQFDFSTINDPVVAIWDGGGTDTIDLSGFSTSQVLNLNEGSFSDVGVGMTGNLAIAYGAVIENGIGGSGNDTFYGNDVNNVILGGNGDDLFHGSTGDDTLNGEVGNDTVNYNYSVTALAFNFIDNVTVSIQHIVDAWTDLVSNIENFIFTDGTYTFAELEASFTQANDFAPVVTASNTSLNLGETVLASTIINASDADGNTLTYEVWDGGKGGASGYFELNGSALSAGGGHTLTEAEFASLNIVGGNATGSDTLWVRVSDGEHTSTWSKFFLTTTDNGGGGGGDGGSSNSAPIVTTSNLTLNAEQNVLASTVISATDTDGDTLTYEVWDAERDSTSGYFELNGVALEAGKGHTLTEAEFANLNIVGGQHIADETLWVRVSDAETTTSWDSFTLSTDTESDDGGGGGGPNNFAPIVSANNLSLDSAESVLASTVISASDADGDTLTYEIWDGGRDSNSGYFELGGTIYTAGHGHTLTQAEFNNLNIVGGSLASNETFWVRVSDGENTTGWQTFTLNNTGIGGGGGGGGGNVAPTATTNDLSLGTGSTILANTVITASDADGDTLTYEVWDSGKGSTSGYFELSGSALAAGKGHTLSQAEFDSLLIVGGSANGTDTLWVRVNDGTDKTSWKSFTLTTDSALGNVLDTNDDSAMAQALEDLSQSSSVDSHTQQSDSSVYGGDVFSGTGGFEDHNNTETVI